MSMEYVWGVLKGLIGLTIGVPSKAARRTLAVQPEAALLVSALIFSRVVFVPFPTV